MYMYFLNFCIFFFSIIIQQWLFKSKKPAKNKLHYSLLNSITL